MLTIFSRTLQKPCLQRYAATNAAVNARPKSKSKETRQAIIQCKRPNFNLYVPQDGQCKFGTIPLASSGWLHKKSKGDWFTINATVTEEEKSKEMQDLHAFLTTTQLPMADQLLENLKQELDIKQLTSIQCQGWPKIYDYHHTLIAAETGCGKTLCYLTPIIQRIAERKQSAANQRKMNSPLCIILTPGRELAAQIGNVAKDLCTDMDVRVKTILGGNTKRLMMNPEFDDVDIVVASVGALSKLVTTGIYRMDHVRHVVLDEADTLLDDSFSDKLVHFMKRFPFHKNRSQTDTEVGTQLVLASATMPTNISELLHRVIDVQTIEEVSSENLHKLMPHVEQKFLRVNKADRPAHLLSIVKKEVALRRPIIIFSNKTPTCDYVSIFLNNSGVNCLNLNGDMLMKIRMGRFEQFQNAECDVLSTTDVGSRGLDTTRARNVINFDFPLHISDYIHRSGRIGRVGNMERCTVTNLISSRREIDVVQRIEHAARCGGLLPDVNANIKNIINKKIMKDMQDAGIPLPTPLNGQQDEAF
ncbi:probable ATP-dependent RNA helicase DDX28 [Musca domestica]|uniref:Probable ATP-dependent RNA helicase DDX28 n=1 Tax=Musca domestica TaxID=7370 RepID=A0A9J7I6A9_MUSDO|nr:probable ATP-dependent RNA helicase DDX28 [Musca domestica]